MTRKNTHLDHIDESHFINGSNAVHESLNALQSLIEGRDNVFVTEKWDGAPAIFAGTDPVDGKFFVSTKSVFNKEPKLYKNVAECICEGAKGEKLADAFLQLMKLNIPENVVLQGDLLWHQRDDHKYRTYENKRYVTVHPNTLIYAWETNTPEALEVERAAVGIVFHTTYTGKGSLSEYSATFGADISVLTETPDVWVRDAKVTTEVSTTQYNRINEKLNLAEDTSFNADTVANIMKLIPEAFSGARIQAFYNSQIRQGLYPYDAKAYFKHVQDYYTKQMDKVKTDAAKQKRETQVKQLLAMMKQKEKQFHNAFYYTSKINEAKLATINALNKNNTQKVFVEMNGQLVPTTAEGYVIVDVVTGNGMKLVDRENFSFYNFNESVTKGWM